MAYVLGFEQVSKASLPSVGGKNASLGEMLKAGIRVPPGFAITTDSYLELITAAGIIEEMDRILAHVNPDHVPSLDRASAQIQALIMGAHLPPAITKAVEEHYCKLCEGCCVEDLPVAVRSSATAEDLPNASFAGQQDTYLWVVGEDSVVEKVKACWASLFNARAISYRTKNHLGQIDVLMSVGVQKMVNAAAAGVAMTLDPITGDRTKIVIDSAFGLGEPVVSGEITPDNFVVEKVLMQILKRRIAEKDFELVADPAARRTVERVIAPERRTLPSLTDAQVLAVATLAKSLERSMGGPQDVEWAIDADLPEGENLVALQSRPETVWSQKKSDGTKKTYEIGIAGVLGTLMAPVQAKR